MLAYHKALGTGDLAALKAISDARAKAIFDKFEKQGEARQYANFRWEELHYRMKTLAIVGGFVKGDRAVVLFDGSSTLFDALHGEAVLRREGGAWLIDDELVQVGKCDR